MAALPPAALRRSLAEALAPLGCALVSGEVSEQGTVTLTGVVSLDSEPILRRILLDTVAATPTDWKVATVSGPYCRVLDTLREATTGLAAPSASLKLGLRGGVRRLEKDDFLVPEVRMPDFPAVLTLDYFASDGSLSHLRFKTPPGPLPAGDKVSVGDPHPADPGANLPAADPPGWQVAEPYGTDLLVAIASQEPLFAKPRPDDDTPEAYLRDLRASLAAMQRRGERVAVAAVPVETAPR
jgi:hypothetical protein